VIAGQMRPARHDERVDLADQIVVEALALAIVRQLAAGTLAPGTAGGIAAALPEAWEPWLRALFPQYLTTPAGAPVAFAPHHAQLWDWVWALMPGQTPPAFIAIWPRGGGKSTTVELACAAIAARRSRRYALYCCVTQELVDTHVMNIAALLESPRFGQAFPAAASRMVGKYGSSRGWRRNRLRTASGFTVDAVGLDTARRGIKIEEARPDLIVFDDLDDPLDTAATTEKKITLLTRNLLPAGATDLAVVGVQNLVKPDGIFAQLADGRADWLADRIVSGPLPAVAGLT
jgi:hypothetical protein